MISEILGKKLGMTQVYDAQNVLVPVTVVEAGPCSVVQVKTVEIDGYNAVQLGFSQKKAKNTAGGEIGHAKKAGLAWAANSAASTGGASNGSSNCDDRTTTSDIGASSVSTGSENHHPPVPNIETGARARITPMRVNGQQDLPVGGQWFCPLVAIRTAR